MKKKRYTIGLLINQIDGSTHVPFWKGIADAAEYYDCNLVIYTGKIINSDLPHEARENIIYELPKVHPPDGLVLASAALSSFIGIDTFTQFCRGFGDTPLVSMGQAIPGIPSVVIDNKAGVKELMNHFIRVHQLKKIVFIKGIEHNYESRTRFEAYCESLEENGIAYDPRLVVQGNYRKQDVYKVIADLVEDGSVEFDAVVSASDEMAMNAMQELKRHGIHVPKELAIGGFDDIEDAKFVAPPLTTVKNPLRKIAKTSVRILLALMEGEEVSETTTIQAPFIIRQSCGCFAIPEVDYESVDTLKQSDSSIKTGLQDYKNQIANNMVALLKISADDANDYFEYFHLLCYCLFHDIEKKRINGYFLDSLNTVALKYVTRDNPVYSWYDILYILRKEVLSILSEHEQQKTAEEIFNSGHLVLRNIYQQREGYLQYQFIHLNNNLRNIMLQGANTREIRPFLKIIANNIARVRVNTLYMAFFDGKCRQRDSVNWDLPEESFLVMAAGENTYEISDSGFARFSTSELLPAKYSPDKRFTWIVRSLITSEDHLGYIIYDAASREELVYVSLHDIIAAGMQSILLFEQREKTRAELGKTLERLQAQTLKLEQSNRELSRLDDLKNEFIANITHDFRSPLTAILNTAEFYLNFQNDISRKDKEGYSIIHEASLKLKSATDHLLDIAKIEALGFTLNIEQTHLKPLLGNVVDYFRSSQSTNNIKFNEDFSGVHSDIFYSDTERLEIILNNIFSNAINVVNPDDGVISITLSETDTVYKIGVSDNGIGIPPDKLDVIFKRFERLSPSNGSSYQGSGIGLSYAKQLTECLNGKIWAESDGEGKGATFFLELPKGDDILTKNGCNQKTISN